MSVHQTISGRYEIHNKPVGHGGMGVVYRAYDNVTKRYVALKTMRGIVEPAALDLFTKEWSALAKLSHPNIVDILDTGQFEEEGQQKPFFVMPLLPGVTLDHLIRNASQRLTVERTIEIICQTCRGLQAAHEQGVIHRDLKPSNIFVMEDDAVKIIDFGVVHLTGAHSVTGIKGTLQYMAPEQIAMKPASPASDVFSLGVVCYEALTGRKPFARATDAETAEAIRHDIPPPASDINTSVSQILGRVVHKAMAKQPWHRFSSARDFAETLQKALANQPIERFERARIQPRIERSKRAYAEGDYQFALEILTELEAEGNIDPDMTMLRLQIEQAVRQKSIRQLLASARTRFEEEEFPLALSKIQEILDIDPENMDALALRSEIEKQRSDRQIENWFRLVNQHIDHLSFSQARKGLQEILAIRANDARALELLAEVDRREQESTRIRQEKEQLYHAALSSYQHGEVSSALTKLERILELNRLSPDFATPERDALYQNLYNQIRSERETARNSYAEGKRHLADRNFAKALEICDDFLRRYPSDPMFQALKLEVEEQQRQERSAYIADVGHRLDAEANLDRRVSILKEAVERYPDEPHLQQSLRLTRERRDLVNSIVSRARQYEERSQFNEALGQLDILRNIYAQYPGLEFEIQRLVRRREDQARHEAKAKWVEQIDRQIELGDFGRAHELARSALEEFNDDRELAGLERIAQQGVERSAEARVLLEQGRRLCLERQFAEGLQAFRKASGLNPRDPIIRASLLNALVEQARSVLNHDWRAAEPLVQEALEMDPANAVAQSLQSLIADSRRQEDVNDCISRARELQANNDVKAALFVVENALEAYPGEMRLLQLRSTLGNQLVAATPPRFTAPPQPPAPPEPEPAKANTAPPEPVERKFEEAILGATPEPVPARQASVPEPVPVKSKPPRAADPWWRVQWRHIAAGSTELIRGLPAIHKGSLTPLQIGVVIAIPLILIAALTVAVAGRWPRLGSSIPAAGQHSVILESNIKGTRYFIDGRAVESLPVNLPAGTHRVEAAAEGYRTASESIRLEPGGPSPYQIRFDLQPEPLNLRLFSDLKTARVSFDDQPAGELQEGSFVTDGVSYSAHTFRLHEGSGELLTVQFQARPGELPLLSAPVSVRNTQAVVVTQLGSRARIYATQPLQVGRTTGSLQTVPGDGLELTGLSSSTNTILLTDGKDSRQISVEMSNAPLVSVWLTSDRNIGTVIVESNVPDAQVIVDGRPRTRPLRDGRAVLALEPGRHSIRLSKEDYEDVPEQTVEIRKGDSQRLAFELKPVVRTSSLSIEGATPGADVLLDGARIGRTGPDGTFSQADITPGRHTISLRRENFEERLIQETFTGGATVTISGGSGQLRAFGSVMAKVSPPDATITLKREGDMQSRTTKSGQSISLPAGKYQLSAQSAGHTSRLETIAIEPGKQTAIDWVLAATPTEAKAAPPPKESAGYFENPSAWKKYGEWWMRDRPGMAWFAVNRGSFLIDFLKQSGRVLFVRTSKRIEWVVDYKNQDNQIAYSLDGKTIHRRQLVAGKTISETRQPAAGCDGDICRLEIEITPAHVVIRSGSGKFIIDDVKRPDPSAALGRFGFNGEVVLIPRRYQQ
ncbi:MAG: protein kinase [Bryobacterales bacterium]|nr:protein kinase [Bryobacterales bacterium]